MVDLSPTAPSSTPPVETRTDPLFLTVATLVVLGLVGSLWTVGYLPTHDGPHHIYSGFLENHLDRMPEPFRDLWHRNPQLTSHGFRLLFVPFERVLGWKDATRLTLSVWTVVWSVGAILLVASLDRRRRWLALLALPGALGWAFYAGLFSFVAATGLGFVILAATVRVRRWGAVFCAILSAALFLQASVHLFAAEALGVILACLVIARSRPGERLRRLTQLALIGLPAGAVAAVVSFDLYGGAPLTQAWTWLGARGQLEMAARASLAGPWWRCYPPVIVALVGVTSAFLRWRRLHLDERAVAAAAGLFAACSLLLPFTLPGWEALTPRFSINAVVLGLALVPVERLGARMGRGLLPAIAILFSAANLVWTAHFHRALDRGFSPIARAMSEELPRTGFRLFVPLRSLLSESPRNDTPWVEGVGFARNCAPLFAMAQGGQAITFNGVVGIHTFTLRADPDLVPEVPRSDWLEAVDRIRRPVSTPDEAGASRELARAFATRVAERATAFEDLILFGPRDERTPILARGFVADYDSELVSISRFEGCPLSLQLPPEWGRFAPVLVEYGWAPLSAPHWRTTLQASPAAGRLVPLPDAPCGPLWVRVVHDLDRSSVLSPGDELCRGADTTGLLHLVGTSETRVVPCREPDG